MINIRKTDEAVILDIVEDLDTPHKANQLEKALKGAASEDVELVIINLDQVQIVPQNSWGIIVALAAEFRPERKEIKLVGLAPHIRRQLDLVEGSKVIEIFESEDDAIKSFSENVTSVERNALLGFK